jgi:hypothetical protein
MQFNGSPARRGDLSAHDRLENILSPDAPKQFRPGAVSDSVDDGRCVSDGWLFGVPVPPPPTFDN